MRVEDERNSGLKLNRFGDDNSLITVENNSLLCRTEPHCSYPSLA